MNSSKMNSQEEIIFFALMRNALWKQPLETETWTGEWTWKPIAQYILDHCLQTLFAEPVLSLPDDKKPSAKAQSYFTQMLALNIQEHIRLDADLVKIFQMLQDKGFHPVLLKGQGNATYYPNPMIRKCGDIDVYIGEQDYEAACNFMLQMDGVSAGKENEKHLELFYGKTEIEIHKYAELPTPPQKNEPYQQLIKYYFSHPDYVKINGTDIPVPPKQFVAMYVFYHLWHHFKFGGVGYRQFADWAIILHHFAGQIDLDRLKKDLEAVNLMEDWQMAGLVLVKLMGLPVSEFPFYKDDTDEHALVFARLVLDDGNFASSRRAKRYTSYFMIKCQSFYMLLVRGRELAKISKRYALRYAISSIHRGLINLGRKLRGENI